MILTEKIPESTLKELNDRIADRYGKYLDGKPNFRLVWSEDQLEKRSTTYTDEGFQLIHPEVRELPKYRQWIHKKYLLERLAIVPEYTQTDLVEKFSYEPIWVFESTKGIALVPVWEAIYTVLQSLMNAVTHTGHTKYKDPELGDTQEETDEIREIRLKKLEEDLYGNETDTNTAMSHGEAIVVPRSYES